MDKLEVRHLTCSGGIDNRNKLLKPSNLILWRGCLLLKQLLNLLMIQIASLCFINSMIGVIERSYPLRVLLQVEQMHLVDKVC